jgi:hypothetical protein
MLTIITLPEGFATDITGYMSDLVTDLSPYITLVLGVILTAIVIKIIIGSLHR